MRHVVVVVDGESVTTQRPVGVAAVVIGKGITGIERDGVASLLSPDAATALVRDDTLRTTPSEHDLDGFFARGEALGCRAYICKAFRVERVYRRNP